MFLEKGNLCTCPPDPVPSSKFKDKLLAVFLAFPPLLISPLYSIICFKLQISFYLEEETKNQKPPLAPHPLTPFQLSSDFPSHLDNKALSKDVIYLLSSVPHISLQIPIQGDIWPYHSTDMYLIKVTYDLHFIKSMFDSQSFSVSTYQRCLTQLIIPLPLKHILHLASGERDFWFSSYFSNCSF